MDISIAVPSVENHRVLAVKPAEFQNADFHFPIKPRTLRCGAAPTMSLEAAGLTRPVARAERARIRRMLGCLRSAGRVKMRQMYKYLLSAPVRFVALP